jgi:hypothetical protein
MLQTRFEPAITIVLDVYDHASTEQHWHQDRERAS